MISITNQWTWIKRNVCDITSFGLRSSFSYFVRWRTFTPPSTYREVTVQPLSQPTGETDRSYKCPTYKGTILVEPGGGLLCLSAQQLRSVFEDLPPVSSVWRGGRLLLCVGRTQRRTQMFLRLFPCVLWRSLSPVTPRVPVSLQRWVGRGAVYAARSQRVQVPAVLAVCVVHQHPGQLLLHLPPRVPGGRLHVLKGGCWRRIWLWHHQRHFVWAGGEGDHVYLQWYRVQARRIGIYPEEMQWVQVYQRGDSVQPCDLYRSTPRFCRLWPHHSTRAVLSNLRLSRWPGGLEWDQCQDPALRRSHSKRQRSCWDIQQNFYTTIRRIGYCSCKVNNRI